MARLSRFPVAGGEESLLLAEFRSGRASRSGRGWGVGAVPRVNVSLAGGEGPCQGHARRLTLYLSWAYYV